MPGSSSEMFGEVLEVITSFRENDGRAPITKRTDHISTNELVAHLIGSQLPFPHSRGVQKLEDGPITQPLGASRGDRLQHLYRLLGTEHREQPGRKRPLRELEKAVGRAQYLALALQPRK